MREFGKEELVIDDKTYPQMNFSQEQKKVEIKQEEPLPPKKEKMVLNKFNNNLKSILITVLLFTIIICLLQFVNADISNYMWLNINNKIFEIKYNIMQNFSFLSSYGNIILAIIFGIIAILSVVVMFIFKNDINKKTKAINIIIPFAVFFSFILIFDLYYFFSEASHRGINEIYMKDHLNSTYFSEDLNNVVEYFKNSIVTYSESLDRKNGKIVINKEPYNSAVENLNSLSNKYDFLKGSFPKKIRALNNYDLKSSNYPDGLTYNFTVGIDENNLSDLDKIFTLTHEFCHVKGIYRESDANYCAFLAGHNSNDDVSKYATYLNIFPSLLNILKDKYLYDTIYDEFGSICLDSNYDEICNLYSKDLNRFKNKSDSIELYTYSLKVYKNHKEELKQYLLGLNNRFNVTITTGDNKISLEEANRLIDEEANLILHINGNITEKLFIENNKYLNTVSNYFPHLYLKNSKEVKKDYSNFDYLKPYPNDNYASLFESKPEFGYDRAVRSIIEYFDKYVFD